MSTKTIKFIADVKALNKICGFVSPATEKREIFEHLKCYKFEVSEDTNILKVTATDNIAQASAEMKLESCSGSGAFLVPGREMTALTGAAPSGHIEIEAAGTGMDEIKVKTSTGGKYKYKSHRITEWDPVRGIKPNFDYSLKAADAIRAYRYTAYTVSDVITKFDLRGVALYIMPETMRWLGTNGERFGQISVDLDEGSFTGIDKWPHRNGRAFRPLIPKAAMAAMQKIAAIALSLGDGNDSEEVIDENARKSSSAKNASIKIGLEPSYDEHRVVTGFRAIGFKFANFEYSMQLHTGSFPEMDVLFAKEFGLQMIVKTAELRQALNLVEKVIADEQYNRCTLVISDTHITIFGQNTIRKQTAVEKISIVQTLKWTPGDHPSKNWIIPVKLKYLKEALASIEDEQVELAQAKAGSSLQLKGCEHDSIALIQPMNANDFNLPAEEDE